MTSDRVNVFFENSLLPIDSDDAEEMINGGVSMMQVPCGRGSSGGRKIDVKVIVERDLLYNIINERCVRRFDIASWGNPPLNRPVPKDGDKVKLQLSQISSFKTFVFEFYVVKDEPRDMVLGHDAFQKVEKGWLHLNSPIYIILNSKSKSRGKKGTESKEAAGQAAATEARRKQDEHEENSKRQERRQDLRGCSQITDKDPRSQL